MNSFTTFFSRKQLEASFGILRSRFLLPTLILVILTGFLFYVVNVDVTPEDLWISRIILSCIVTFFLSTWVILSLESEKKNKLFQLFMILPMVYGIVFYLTVDPSTDWWVESVSYFLLHLTWFVSFLFFAPYITRLHSKESESIEYTNYFSRIAWVFLMSGIVGGSLIALWYIAIASVIALFDIGYDIIDQGKVYGNWAVVSLALIAPIYGLIALPHKGDLDQKSYEINRFFSFLIRYIAVPFIFIYFLILYAYSAKVLMNFQDWPKGMISWMVIGFSTFGYLAYIFSKPYEEESDIVHTFRKFFPLVVIPQVFMLAYAIWLRIAQYDLTMNRYFVVIFGMWLLLVSIYLIVSKKRSLAIITASLTLISLLISVGPWSVYSVPLERQYSRLLRNLESARILQGSVIVPLSSPKDISKELSDDIYSGIDYACDFSECQRIKELFSRELATPSIQAETDWKKWNTKTGAVYPGMSKWEIIRAVTDAIKVQQSYAYENEKNTKYIQYNTSYQPDAPYPLSLEAGYTKLVRVYGSSDSINSVKGANTIYPFVTMNPDTTSALYHRGSGDTLSLSFNPPTDLVNMTTPTWLDQKDLTFTLSGRSLDVKLYLQSFAIRNPEYTGTGGYEYYTISGIGLVKER